jgi:hypothetical protein
MSFTHAVVVVFVITELGARGHVEIVLSKTAWAVGGEYSVVPSHDSAGAPSLKALLTTGPKLTGTDHGAVVLSLVETHKLMAPKPPGRLELRNNSSPSFRMVVRVSR